MPNADGMGPKGKESRPVDRKRDSMAGHVMTVKPAKIQRGARRSVPFPGQILGGAREYAGSVRQAIQPRRQIGPGPVR
jgi:hypothetical protein